MNKEVFDSCKKKELLYFTHDETEIAEALEKEKVKSYAMCWRVAKVMVEKGDFEKLKNYFSHVDPSDVSSSELVDGFLRTPKNDEEKKLSEWYCLAEPFEPLELAEADDWCNCEGVENDG